MDVIVQMMKSFLEILRYIWTNIGSIEALVSIGVVLGGLLTYIGSEVRNRSLNRYLRRWMGKDALKSMKYYIDTIGQQVDPCENDEIGEANQCKITRKLIPFFIKEVFKNQLPNQYIVILGDSGTGKTTFMIQLFKTYRKKYLKKHKIELIPLSYQTCINEIGSIEEPENTILLLDGLDENPDALDNYEEFMEELLKRTQLFYKVIITCRTQFFPNEKSEPYETGHIRFNMKNKKNLFYKIYVSPFNNEDINRFLRTKYPFLFNLSKRKKAKEVILKTPYLMVRPMLLSYIDDLIQEENEYQYVYQVYEQLTDKWLRRENVPYETLYEFTRITARFMYDHNSNYIAATAIAELCEKFHINLREIEAKSRSLLNRNGIGDYKFAHKSIYEYFLAKEALENQEFREVYDFSKHDMARLFFQEMCSMYMEQELQKDPICGNFTKLYMEDIDFTGKGFEKAVFRGAQMKNCIFNDCDLQTSDLDNCMFDHCIFKKTILVEERRKGIMFRNCDLSGAVLSGTAWQNIEFSHCTMPETMFSQTVCEDICFDSCELMGVHFEQSRINGGIFLDSDLRGTDMRGSRIKHNSFINVNVAFSDFSDVIVEEECIFRNVTWAPIVYDNLQIDSSTLLDIQVANNVADKLRHSD